MTSLKGMNRLPNRLPDNPLLAVLCQIARAGVSEPIELRRRLAIDQGVLQLILDDLVRRRWLAETWETGDGLPSLPSESQSESKESESQSGREFGVVSVAANRMAASPPAHACAGCPLGRGRRGPVAGGSALPPARRYLLTPAGRRAMEAMQAMQRAPRGQRE